MVLQLIVQLIVLQLIVLTFGFDAFKLTLRNPRAWYASPHLSLPDDSGHNTKEVSINGGTPIAGWFIMEYTKIKWMIWGYPCGLETSSLRKQFLSWHKPLKTRHHFSQLWCWIKMFPFMGNRMTDYPIFWGVYHGVLYPILWTKPTCLIGWTDGQSCSNPQSPNPACGEAIYVWNHRVTSCRSYFHWLMSQFLSDHTPTSAYVCFSLTKSFKIPGL